MISSGNQYTKFDYYSKDPIYTVDDGRFIGGLAKELGFNEMNADNMVKLQAGQNEKGEQIIKLAGNGGVEHNPGKDFTFSIEKDFSILRFSKDTPQEIKDAIDKAMFAASEKIVNTMVSEGMITYREHGEEIKHTAIENTNQISARAFIQSTSRNNDPDLHVHIAFFNMAKVGEGYRAIKFDGVLVRDGKAFLDQVGKNEFYQSLQKNLGKDLSQVITKNQVTGIMSAGFDRETIEQFSTRQTEIAKAVEDLRIKYPGASDGLLSQMANNATRNPKDHSFTKEKLENNAEPVKNKSKGVSNNFLYRDLDEKVTIDKKDKFISDIKMVVKQLGQKEIYSNITTTYKEILKQDKDYTLEQVKEAVNNSKELEFTSYINKSGYEVRQVGTTENVRIEQEVQGYIKSGKEQSFSIDKIQVSKGIKGFEKANKFELQNEQISAIHQTLAGQDKITIIAGKAGTGKTTIFSAINEIAKKNDINVIGFSNNGAQAQKLEIETGIKSQTLKRFTETIKYAENKGKVIKQNDRKTIVVVDESSLMGVKDTKEFFDTVNKVYTNSKIVMVGDKEQIASISAGRVLGNAMKTEVSQTVLNNIRRQKNEGLKNIIFDMYNKIDNLKGGRIDGQSIVDSLNKKGFIKSVAIGTSQDEAVKQYMEYRENGGSTAVLVRKNETKDYIDNKIRAKLSNAGVLKGKEVNISVLQKLNTDDVNKFRAEGYEKGDIISMRKNEFKEVQSINIQNNTIAVKGVVFASDKNLDILKNKESGKYYVKNGNKEYELRSYKGNELSYYLAEKVIDLKTDKDVSKFQKYAEKEIGLKKGENVMFTENIKNETTKKETIKVTNDNRSLFDQFKTNWYNLKNKKTDFLGQIFAKNKMNKALEKAEKTGETAKAWRLGDTVGVTVYHKDKDNSVVNGERAEYLGRKGTIDSFKTQGGQIKSFDRINDKDLSILRSLQYAYAVTSEKAQGESIKNVVCVENTEKNANKNLVDISRTVDNLKIIVYEFDLVRTKDEKGKDKDSNLDNAFSMVQHKTTSIEQNKGNEKNNLKQSDNERDAVSKETASERDNDYALGRSL